MESLAIISVYDKSNLETFAKGLASRGVKVLSTGGTATFLKQHGLAVESISTYTGHPEILDGRVKSLHPKIHGGILARRDQREDLRQLEEHKILPIDFVVVNLYPFIHQVQRIEEQGRFVHESLVEFIDIGGPTMIRAAAKNARFVVPVCDPTDYPLILAELDAEGEVSEDLRRRLAAKVFKMMSAYDGAISRYFSLGERLLEADGAPTPLAPVETVTLERIEELRYGENPHQKAGLYRPFRFPGEAQVPTWEQLQGKEISYNNLLDMHGALDLFLELYDGLNGEHAAVVIKHSNPCGAALASTPLDAFVAARECDPLSAFGGIVAVSGTMDGALAEAILEGFVEVVLTEDLTEDGLAAFARKKNVRVLKCDFAGYLEQKRQGNLSIRNAFGDFLIQTTDNTITIPTAEHHTAGPTPDASLLEDLVFAWKICKHVKSNAIVIAKGKRAIGIGAGQMSRVDAAKLAVERARFHGHDPLGGAAASDAFLPFPDTLEMLNDAGVKALVQPGGSIKDADVVQCAEQRGVTMLCTGERHFRH
ncbi:MAG: bifunctional phosphoribosylaminoimidazolecarboxamide formyltransferase/IMP cyclohydrolase [Bdellovibrionales bacterium]|nr:bifunctional phosphoribosylaminoimidazolecarboxamide formyltransferase/IMP cyclohydrolase [Bdellovibrionales bacterium]